MTRVRTVTVAVAWSGAFWLGFLPVALGLTGLTAVLAGALLGGAWSCLVLLVERFLVVKSWVREDQQKLRCHLISNPYGTLVLVERDGWVVGASASGYCGHHIDAALCSAIAAKRYRLGDEVGADGYPKVTVLGVAQ